MSTISSIGVGKTYTTLAAWHAAFAAGGWIGEVYGELTDTLDFSGAATSATNYIILRPASGQGTAAISSAGPLRYDGTLGGAVKDNTAYGSVFHFHENYVMLQQLQTQEQHVSAAYAIDNDNTSDTIVIDRCIAESGSNSNDAVRMRSGYLRNSLLENRGTSGGGILLAYAFPHVIACTIVRPSDKGAAGNGFNGGGAVAIDCAVYGFSAFNTGTMGTGSDYNSSDKTIPIGTHNQASKVYVNQFANTVDATRDFRAKAGADLLDNGVVDSTTYPAWAVAASSFGAIDIIGTSRPQGSAWDIGAWELLAGGTVYNVSVSEAGSAADTIGSAAIFPRTMTEAATATSTQGSSAVQPAAISETAAAADTISGGSTYGATITEAGTAADTTNAGAIKPAAIAEAATATDTVGSAAVFPRAVTEAGSAADTAASSAVRPAPIAEAASAVDTVNGATAISGAILEAASAVDHPASSATLAAGVTEAANAVDHDDSSTPGDTAIVETMTATDVWSAAVITRPSVVEIATALETVAAGAIFQGAITETMSAADAIAAQAALGALIAEVANAQDTELANLIMELAIAEAANAVDAVDSTRGVLVPSKCDSLSGPVIVRSLSGPPIVRSLSGGCGCE